MKLTLGQYLRQLREERGFSLEQLAQATRINPTYLRALENDEPALLPSAVQGRGYLRLIASTFNINPQPLLAAFPYKELVLSSPATEENPVVEEAQPERTQPASVSTSPPVNETTPQTEAADEVYSETVPQGEAISSEDTQLSSLPVEGSSTFIFSQIGQQFRAQREALGISLEDAERFTRLKARYLRAIEEGLLEQLPSLVQGRGMLRNYAEFLNLDSEAILLQFADGLQRRRLEHLAATAPSRATTSPAGKTRFPNRFSLFLRRWMTPDLLVGSMLFFILLVFVIWGTARVSGLQDQETQVTPPSISEILLNTADVNGSTIAALAESPTPTAAQNNTFTTLPSSPEESGESPSQPPASSDPVQVYVIANQRVWMRVVVDTRVAFEGRTIPGSTYPFTAKDAIELTAGNAAGIQIVYNQNNLGNLGGAGDVIRLIFTAQGTVVPTPLFTSTPAPTLPPTFIPQPRPLLPTPTVTPFVP